MNEYEISIDIHSSKLQEWLISRRIVPKNIQPYVEDIRAKISNALNDMPCNDGLVKLLSGNYVNYFHCKEIIEILKQTEKDTKSVFGTYGSQRMKDWLEILKLYEKQNIYIGEAAQIFVRNLNYEIPNMKKQIAKLEQRSEECLKKIYDFDKTKQTLLSERGLLCLQLGIKGEDLKNELNEKIKELPKIYEKSVSDLKNIIETVGVYIELSGNCNSIPLLKHVAEFGNTTVYQYLNKEVPLKIEKNYVNLSIDSNLYEIDYPSRNFGKTLNIEKETVPMDSPFEFTSIIRFEPTGVTSAKGAENKLPENNKEVTKIKEFKWATGDQAYSIMDSPYYREKFIDELYELESFLKLREYEISQHDIGNNVIFSLMGNMSSHDLISVQKQQKQLEQIIANVQSEQAQHLFQLKHSPKYTNILVGKFKQKLIAVEKIKTAQGLLKAKSVELKKEKDQLKPLLTNTIAKTKLLQSQIESDISKRYKNRPVNIVSGINVI
ncbi:CDK5RAP3-like protein [Condylostylus longicornis]|uniref:CDK5RAP3-like protein n=1 Tax=Condylostylus longicornis TaxID=2530218 RepID=UPI00244DE922|nr:CDK5RAP3-like protein [Condylostylus longicornis]